MYSRIKFSLFLIIRSDYRLRSPNGNSHVLPLFNPSTSSFSKQKRTTRGADLSLSGIIKIRRHQSDTVYSILLSVWHVLVKSQIVKSTGWMKLSDPDRWFHIFRLEISPFFHMGTFLFISRLWRQTKEVIFHCFTAYDTPFLQEKYVPVCLL